MSFYGKWILIKLQRATCKFPQTRDVDLEVAHMKAELNAPKKLKERLENPVAGTRGTNKW